MTRNNKFERNMIQRMTVLETLMKEVKDNHLPHIEKKFDKIEKRFDISDRKIEKIQGVVWKTSGGVVVLIVLADIVLRVLF